MLAVRSPEVLGRWDDVECPEVHPLFTPVDGAVAPWERNTSARGGTA